MEVAILRMSVPKKSFTPAPAPPRHATTHSSLLCLRHPSEMPRSLQRHFWEPSHGGSPAIRIWGCRGHPFLEPGRCGRGGQRSLWDQTPVLVLTRVPGGGNVLTSRWELQQQVGAGRRQGGEWGAEDRPWPAGAARTFLLLQIAPILHRP